MKHLMKRWYGILAALLLTTLIMPAIAGCSGSSTVTSAASTVLTIINGNKTKTFTMAELKAMTPITGTAGQMSSTGNITGPDTYTGVSVMDLLATVGGFTENNAIRVSAKDAYSMTISYNQLTNGNFTVINSTNGKETDPTKKPVVFVAYATNGTDINTTVGPLRLGIMTDTNQVTEGHWWVKWTEKIEVVTTETPWTLHLEGAITENIDPASFESCAAIGCHGERWADDQGRVWEGIPLYYFVGKVDDTQDTHDEDSFDSALADKGYNIHVVGKDGTIEEFTSVEVKKNKDIILAYRIDGAPLPENQWPLRIVGDEVSKSRQVSQVFKIKLEGSNISSATTTTTTQTTSTTTTTPVNDTKLLTVVTANASTAYTMSQLKALPATTGIGMTKNKAGTISPPSTCTGVTLTKLISESGGMTTTQSVKLTAADGFSKTFTYDQVYSGTGITVMDKSGNATTPTAPPYALLIYTKDGSDLDSSAGPLQLGIITAADQVSESSLWVKSIVKIEIINP
jgi:DMSO/TMAO reductase YedYZ molybdopterin-dependent catalytic subunit